MGRDVQYSQSVAAGDLVFTAGQGGFDDDGNVVEGGIEAQVRQTFANVASALAVHGASLDGIVKLTVYVADRADYDVFKRVRAELLDAAVPAARRSQATLLIDGMLFEMDAVAVRAACAGRSDRALSDAAVSAPARPGHAPQPHRLDVAPDEPRPRRRAHRRLPGLPGGAGPRRRGCDLHRGHRGARDRAPLLALDRRFRPRRRARVPPVGDALRSHGAALFLQLFHGGRERITSPPRPAGSRAVRRAVPAVPRRAPRPHAARHRRSDGRVRRLRREGPRGRRRRPRGVDVAPATSARSSSRR